MVYLVWGSWESECHLLFGHKGFAQSLHITAASFVDVKGHHRMREGSETPRLPDPPVSCIPFQLCAMSTWYRISYLFICGNSCIYFRWWLTGLTGNWDIKFLVRDLAYTKCSFLAVINVVIVVVLIIITVIIIPRLVNRKGWKYFDMQIALLSSKVTYVIKESRGTILNTILLEENLKESIGWFSQALLSREKLSGFPSHHLWSLWRWLSTEQNIPLVACCPIIMVTLLWSAGTPTQN